MTKLLYHTTSLLVALATPNATVLISKVMEMLANTFGQPLSAWMNWDTRITAYLQPVYQPPWMKCAHCNTNNSQNFSPPHWTTPMISLISSKQLLSLLRMLYLQILHSPHTWPLLVKLTAARRVMMVVRVTVRVFPWRRVMNLTSWPSEEAQPCHKRHWMCKELHMSSSNLIKLRQSWSNLQ